MLSPTETSGNLGGNFYGRQVPGTARFLVDRARRILVGCTITGTEVADFLHAATIAVVSEVPLERLATPCCRSRLASSTTCLPEHHASR